MSKCSWSYDDLVKEIYEHTTEETYGYSNSYIGVLIDYYRKDYEGFDVNTLKSCVKKKMDYYSMFAHNQMLYLFAAVFSIIIVILGFIYTSCDRFSDASDKCLATLISKSKQFNDVDNDKQLNEEQRINKKKDIAFSLMDDADNYEKLAVEQKDNMYFLFGILIGCGVLILIILAVCTYYSKKYLKYYNMVIGIEYYGKLKK